jgi:hypothetical protein
MSDAEIAHSRGLSTEQIAAGTTDPSVSDADTSAQPDALAGDGGFDTDHETHAQLLERDEMQGVIQRWKEIQAQFVDEPRSAVQNADALVADLMQRLASMFAAERDQLESRWTSDGDVSTEDLRQGLQRYRSFFERLLAA